MVCQQHYSYHGPYQHRKLIPLTTYSYLIKQNGITRIQKDNGYVEDNTDARTKVLERILMVQRIVADRNMKQTPFLVKKS